MEDYDLVSSNCKKFAVNIFNEFSKHPNLIGAVDLNWDITA